MLEGTEERLRALEALDTDITTILTQASAVIDALVVGKRADTEANREAFSTSLAQYSKLISDVSGQLRGEVTKLYEASQTSLLPVTAPVQAVAFGALKENQVWKEVPEGRNDNEDEEMVDNP